MNGPYIAYQRFKLLVIPVNRAKDYFEIYKSNINVSFTKKLAKYLPSFFHRSTSFISKDSPEMFCEGRKTWRTHPFPSSEFDEKRTSQGRE